MEQPLTDVDAREAAEWRRQALQVLAIERDAIGDVREAINQSDKAFIRAINILRHCRGKIICSGVGKSGHIAGKAAATFSSTGTPAFFMHPSDAGHGDLGMVGDDDAVLLLSYSGESRELLDLIPAIKRLQVPLIVIVGNADSSLATAADVCLSAAVAREACPHNLAPTASTTAALALADALAMTLLVARGFSPNDFARTHPSGKLGRRLLLRVSDVMRCGGDIPIVLQDANLSDTLLEMTGKRMGMTLVSDGGGALCGIFTDGDLRRSIDDHIGDWRTATVAEVMTQKPRVAEPTMLAADALRWMKDASLNHLAVVDDNKIVGALSFHDLLHHKIL